MNWLKKGPELKLPSFRRSSKGEGDGGGGGRGAKVPDPVADLYYDLRERRLLPLIALVVVAIAAVPLLLGNSEEVVVPPSEPGATAGASNAPGSTLAVVEANPGLRVPKKRLKGRTATDPFKQKFTESGSSGSEGEEEAGGSEATSTTSTAAPEESSEPSGLEIENEEGKTVTVRPTPESESAPGTSGPISPESPNLRFYGFRPNIRFGPAGSEKLKAYEELDVGTRLPETKPVAVFLGVSDDGNLATFGLSSEVVLVKGGGQCIGGAQSCGLLSLKVGEAASLLTGNSERTFRLDVTKIKWVEVNPPKPQKASKSSRKPYLDVAQSFSK